MPCDKNRPPKSTLQSARQPTHHRRYALVSPHYWPSPPGPPSCSAAAAIAGPLPRRTRWPPPHTARTAAERGPATDTCRQTTDIWFPMFTLSDKYKQTSERCCGLSSFAKTMMVTTSAAAQRPAHTAPHSPWAPPAAAPPQPAAGPPPARRRRRRPERVRRRKSRTRSGMSKAGVMSLHHARALASGRARLRLSRRQPHTPRHRRSARRAPAHVARNQRRAAAALRPQADARQAGGAGGRNGKKGLSLAGRDDRSALSSTIPLGGLAGAPASAPVAAPTPCRTKRSGSALWRTPRRRWPPARGRVQCGGWRRRDPPPVWRLCPPSRCRPPASCSSFCLFFSVPVPPLRPLTLRRPRRIPTVTQRSPLQPASPVLLATVLSLSLSRPLCPGALVPPPRRAPPHVHFAPVLVGRRVRLLRLSPL